MQDHTYGHQYLVISSVYAAQHLRINHLIRVIEHAVSNVFGIPVNDLRSSRRCAARIAFARQVAMYLAHVGLGLSLTKVGAIFGRDRTTVAHACGVVEDQRDDPAFDRALTILEHTLAMRQAGDMEEAA